MCGTIQCFPNQAMYVWSANSCLIQYAQKREPGYHNITFQTACIVCGICSMTCM